MRISDVRVVVFGDDPLLASRTERALYRVSFTAHARTSDDELSQALPDGPAWVLRAGAWPLEAPEFVRSATGKPLIALGAVAGDESWAALVRDSGGVLDRAPAPSSNAPAVASVFLEDASVLRDGLRAGASLDAAVWEIVSAGRHRAVRWHALDVGWDRALRVCLAVTTLHRGGAERLVLELADALRARGVEVLLAVLDRPQRETYPVPSDALLVYQYEKTRGRRVQALAEAAAHFGADVIHAHLLDGDEMHALSAGTAGGAALVCTLHNDRPGWPGRLEALRPGDLAMALACSWRVREAAIDLGAPVRVAPNGIDPARLRPADRDETRARLEVPARAMMLLVVANPRTQKRLELAARVLGELRRGGRDAYLVLAGAPLTGNDDAIAAQTRFDEAVRQEKLEPYVRRVGSRQDVASLYAAADVSLTTSDFEGLSIAQLEAIASGRPVVTSDVGGTRELARLHRGYHVVASESATAIAEAAREAADGPEPELAPAFTVRATAARHERLYRAAAASHASTRSRTRSFLLVTNNFSTGGAQASAKRLLFALRARGVDVAAAVLEEQAQHPTRWRRDLEAGGVPVFAAPRAGTCDPAVTARAVSELADRRADHAIVLWNVIPEHKILIADASVGRRVFDVSPGEMFFASLERYFASPRADLPYFDARDYGTLLDGVVVKYASEAARAEGTLGAKVSVIPNGVDIRVRARARRADGPVVFGTLARLSPDKKLEQLVGALRHAGGECVLRVGGTVERGTEDYERELRALAEGMPVEWCGEVESDSFLADLDAFVMVSEPAGCPNAMLEAMAAGLPVAATDAGGASEQVEDGHTGLLVPRGDERALGEAMRRITRDRQLAGALALSAREQIASRFSLSRMTDAYERLLFES